MTTEQIFTHSPIAARWGNDTTLVKLTYKNSARRIIEKVCAYYSVPVHDVINEVNGKREVSFTRKMCIYFIYKNTTLSYRGVAKMFGYRGYEAVPGNLKVIYGLLDVDDQIKRQVEEIQASIKPLRAPGQYSNKTAYGN